MIVAGYLTGLTPGPIVAVVGGLALITFGRVLLVDRVSTAGAAAGLAVIAGALGIAALRWGTLEVQGLTGAQSVLGPTVLVGPTVAASAASVALAAGLVAAGAWLVTPRPTTRGERLGSILEATLAVATLMVVFAIPDAGGGTGFGEGLGAVGRDPAAWSAWVGALAGGVAVVVGLAVVLRKVSMARWAALAVSSVGVVAAAGMTASVL